MTDQPRMPEELSRATEDLVSRIRDFAETQWRESVDGDFSAVFRSGQEVVHSATQFCDAVFPLNGYTYPIKGMADFAEQEPPTEDPLAVPPAVDEPVVQLSLLVRAVVDVLDPEALSAAGAAVQRHVGAPELVSGALSAYAAHALQDGAQEAGVAVRHLRALVMVPGSEADVAGRAAAGSSTDGDLYALIVRPDPTDPRPVDPRVGKRADTSAIVWDY